MEDLASFDEDLSDCLYKLPTENLTLVSVKHTVMKPDLLEGDFIHRTINCFTQRLSWFVIYSWRKLQRR